MPRRDTQSPSGLLNLLWFVLLCSILPTTTCAMMLSLMNTKIAFIQPSYTQLVSAAAASKTSQTTALFSTLRAAAPDEFPPPLEAVDCESLSPSTLSVSSQPESVIGSSSHFLVPPAAELTTISSSIHNLDTMLSSSSSSNLAATTSSNIPAFVLPSSQASTPPDSHLRPLFSSVPAPLSDSTQFVEQDIHSMPDLYQTTPVPPQKSLRHSLGLEASLPQTVPTSITDSSFQGADGGNAISGMQYRQERPKIVGHRGALYDCLENTRESFLRCRELGCDGIELDVFQVKDGSLVVFHGGGSDEKPGDLTEHCLNAQDMSILDLTMDEIQALRFNSENAEFACPKQVIEQGQIPLLSQVLSDLKKDPLLDGNNKPIQVKIELKGPGTVKPVLELVEAMDMVDQCCYSSFQHDMLRELRDLRPDATRYPTGALFAGALPSDYLLRAQACGASEVHVRYDYCTRETVQQIHEAGFGSMAWFRGPIGMTSDAQKRFWDVGNEDEGCYQALFDTGVQQVCLNRPAIAMPMLQQYSNSLSEQGAMENGADSIVTATMGMIQDQTEQDAVSAASLAASIQQSQQGSRVSAY